MKNIVITNFYGYENIGDGAIFDVALKMINISFPGSMIHVHTATTFLAKPKNNLIKTYLHPYGITIKSEKGHISSPRKVLRFVNVFAVSLLLALLAKVDIKLLPKKGDYAFIRSLREADVVLGMGGGYLRTKSAYKDWFGLLLTLLPIFIAHLYNKRILYLPMSFGNFSSSIHEKIVFNLLKNDVLIFRDEISLRRFEKHTNKKLDTYLFPDLALFDTYVNNKKNKKNYVVLTARLWMDELKQKKYEEELALFVNYIWEIYKFKTVFIPMVWNKNEDDDNEVGERIKSLIKNRHIFKIVELHTPLQVKDLLLNARAAICTRMHCAILATVVKTPFITIAYEYKTVGFLKHLDLEKWNIDIGIFSFNSLKEKFDDLINNSYVDFKIKLEKKHAEITKKEKLVEIIRTFKSTI